MGRLSGFRYRDIARKLKACGFEFDRQAVGSHEIWFNPKSNRYTTIPNHSGDMPEGTLRAILRQADLDEKILGHRGIVGADPIGALAHIQLGRVYAL